MQFYAWVKTSVRLVDYRHSWKLSEFTRPCLEAPLRIRRDLATLNSQIHRSGNIYLNKCLEFGNLDFFFTPLKFNSLVLHLSPSSFSLFLTQTQTTYAHTRAQCRNFIKILDTLSSLVGHHFRIKLWRRFVYRWYFSPHTDK